ncbi:hypothetical protein KIN20_013440 [Parelaphostrongylus tenuis]|uniref:Uncharacterized protein n=1 Tax=Parelaphostrongylus tenuis TaxID=148309 RepID=A0AAD5MXI1_PARTN|nr:hypothetical protein KIN20_013440 [Parelaphostrongylus tenuis]
MTKFTTSRLEIFALTFATVLGCGVLPSGQESDRYFITHHESIKILLQRELGNFNVTGFTLPVNMAYSTDASVRMKAFGMAASGGEVQALVSRLVMQTVSLDVLEQQGRNALLSDAIISSILGQLTVNITYEPLECKDVQKDPAAVKFAGMMAKLPHCIVVGNTVTSLCIKLECRYV